MSNLKKSILNLSKRSHIGLCEYMTFINKVAYLHRSIRSAAIRRSDLDITDITNLFCDGYDNLGKCFYSMSNGSSESIYQKSHNSHKLSDFK